MSIVLPFIGREMERVINLLNWIEKLSGQLGRTIYLLPFKGISFVEVERAAHKAFADVQVISDSEGVSSDWVKDDKIRDAAGPNSLFRQAAWFFYVKPMLGPWLYLEPDCVPLAKTWDDQLEAAYRASGKAFMGAKMKAQGGEEYLNGVAIYPQNAVTLAPSLATRMMWKELPETEIAFDIAGGAEVLRKAEFTDLIQLSYRSDEPEARDGAVLFHGDRSGKLLETLSGGDTGNPSLLAAELDRRPKQKAHTPKGTTDKRIRGATNNGVNAAQKSSKRKRGDAKSARNPVTSNGAAKVQSPVAPGRSFDRQFECITVGDSIRAHVSALQALSTNANRRTRILAALRKSKLVRK